MGIDVGIALVGFDEGITVFVVLGHSVDIDIMEGNCVTSALGLKEINEGSSDGDSLVDDVLLGRVVSAKDGSALGCMVLTTDGPTLGCIVLTTDGPTLGPNVCLIDGKEDGKSDDLLVG